jgi:HSP20 family protein
MQSESRETGSGLLFALRDELERWLGAVRGGNGSWVPATDMYEDEGELYIEMELPGVAPGDIEILAEKSEIRIRASSRVPSPPSQTMIHERRRGTYERTLDLGDRWEGEKARADFEHGVLTLRVPLAPVTEGARRIPLDSAKQPSASIRTNAPGDTGKARAILDEPFATPSPASAAPAVPAPPKESAGSTPSGGAPLLIGGPINDKK